MPSTALQVPWSDFADEALVHWRSRARNTRKGMESLIRKIDALGPKTVQELNQAFVARFIARYSTDRSQNAVAALLVRLRSLCGYAVQSGYLDASPFARKPIKAWIVTTPAMQRKRHSPAELRAVLDSLRDRIELATDNVRWRLCRTRALLATIAFTGLMRSEVYPLTVSQIDLGNRLMYVPRNPNLRRKRQAETRPVTMPDELVAILANWLTVRTIISPDCQWLFPNLHGTNYWHGGQLGCKPADQIKKAGEVAGVPSMTPDSVRRSLYAPWWER